MKTNEAPLTPSAKKLIIPLSDNSEFYSDVADYAVIELSAEGIDRIRKLSAVVRELEVYRISKFNYDCGFMAVDYEADPASGKVAMKEFEGRMECTTLNVTDNNFFWSGYYKHTSVRWESESVPLEVLYETGDFDQREELHAVEEVEAGP